MVLFLFVKVLYLYVFSLESNVSFVIQQLQILLLLFFWHVFQYFAEDVVSFAND